MRNDLDLENVQETLIITQVDKCATFSYNINKNTIMYMYNIILKGYQKDIQDKIVWI